MLLTLLEYLWDVCALLIFLIYPLLIYKKILVRKKFTLTVLLTLFFYENQWSNTIFYVLVWQFNYWVVRDLKWISEHNAIGLYIGYKLTLFVLSLYDGFFIYLVYLTLFLGLGFLGYKNKERLMEIDYAQLKTNAVSYLLGKLMSNTTAV